MDTSWLKLGRLFMLAMNVGGTIRFGRGEEGWNVDDVRLLRSVVWRRPCEQDVGGVCVDTPWLKLGGMCVLVMCVDESLGRILI